MQKTCKACLELRLEDGCSPARLPIDEQNIPCRLVFHLFVDREFSLLAHRNGELVFFQTTTTCSPNVANGYPRRPEGRRRCCGFGIGSEWALELVVLIFLRANIRFCLIGSLGFIASAR